MVITLTTDFGLADNYVGVMHGVILSLNPAAVVVNLCHGVPPQDIAAGAFILAHGCFYFPPDALHVAVIDPGVGGERAALAAASSNGIFLAPDNGLLSDVWRTIIPGLPDRAGTIPASALMPAARVVRLTKQEFWRPIPPSGSVFHGRDIFAPVAAHLSLGVSLDQIGEPAETVKLIASSRPSRRADGTLIAHVCYVDRFGNLVTDLPAAEALDVRPLALKLRGRIVPGLYSSYADGPPLHALIGSTGHAEIALREGSAARLLRARRGDEVEVLRGQAK